MIELPTVAVLLPVYAGDKPEWFAEALKSVEMQEYPSSKIHIYIGIDGKIPHSIEEIISEKEKSIYKIVKNENNLGLCAILNKLIDHLSDEKYVFRMDADDVCEKNRFSKQVEYMERNPDIDVLGSAIVEVDEKGNELFVRIYPEDNESIRKYICKGSPLAHSTVCFRRNIFYNGIRYPGKLLNEDIALWFLLLEKGYKISNLRETLVKFRRTESLYSRRRSSSLTELKVYLQGIWKLHGISFRYIFPILRFLFRLMPHNVIRKLYNSSIRSFLLR